jgi:hypothetical protein
MSKKVTFILVNLENKSDILEKYFDKYPNWLVYWDKFENLSNYDCLVTR